MNIVLFRANKCISWSSRGSWFLSCNGHFSQTSFPNSPKDEVVRTMLLFYHSWIELHSTSSLSNHPPLWQEIHSSSTIQWHPQLPHNGLQSCCHTHVLQLRQIFFHIVSRTDMNQHLHHWIQFHAELQQLFCDIVFPPVQDNRFIYSVQGHHPLLHLSFLVDTPWIFLLQC